MDICPQQLVPKLRRQFLYRVCSEQILEWGCERVRSFVWSRVLSEQGVLRACSQTITKS